MRHTGLRTATLLTSAWVALATAACGDVKNPAASPLMQVPRARLGMLGWCPYTDDAATGPFNVTGTVISPGDLRLTWSPVSGAVRYQVFRVVYFDFEDDCIPIPFDTTTDTTMVISYRPDWYFTSTRACQNDFYSVKAIFADSSYSRFEECVGANGYFP